MAKIFAIGWKMLMLLTIKCCSAILMYMLQMKILHGLMCGRMRTGFVGHIFIIDYYRTVQERIIIFLIPKNQATWPFFLLKFNFC